MLDPHYRAFAVLEFILHGKLHQHAAYNGGNYKEDPLFEELLAAARLKKDANPELIDAWFIFKDPKKRVILDALLLSGAMYDAIEKCTEVPLSTIQLYEEYIFCLNVFSNKLDRLAYVNHIKQYATAVEMSYFQTALTGGPEMLQWLLSHNKKGRPKHTPLEVLETLMTDTMYKALATKHAPLDSNESKIGVEYSKLAIQAAAQLQKLNPTDDADALSELRIALAYKDETINKDNDGAPSPSEIVH